MEDFEISVKDQVVTRKIFNQYDPFLQNEIENIFQLIKEPRENYKSEINLRKGQGKFKGEILKAYNNMCCVSGETCPELLEAAHLQKYLNTNSNHIQNGILLRVDLHRLYDNGLLYIDGNFNIHVSPILNSTAYRQFHGAQIALPHDVNNYPSRFALESRLENFRR
jgi:putative restriction endonuclease